MDCWPIEASCRQCLTSCLTESPSSPQPCSAPTSPQPCPAATSSEGPRSTATPSLSSICSQKLRFDQFPVFYVNFYILYVYKSISCIFHVTEPRNRSTTLAASSYCFWEVRPSIRPATVLSFQRRFGFRDLSLQAQGPSPASPEIKVNSL